MMSRYFRLNSELTGAIAKRPPHAKNQLSVPGSFFNQFVTDIYMACISQFICNDGSYISLSLKEYFLTQ